MKNSTIIIAIILIIIAGGVFVYANSGSNPDKKGDSNGTSGEVQKVVLSYKNYNYYPNTVTVKANQPVSIYLDKSVTGCYRAFTIRQLGLQKNLATPNDALTFTPTQKGTYQFACSMGMGTGTLIVE